MTKPLRRGWSTGAMATAAVKAAFGALLRGEFADSVSITLPGGRVTPQFRLLEKKLGDGVAVAALRKDAGDDPDVTHGALIRARVRLTPVGGVRFKGGKGVGEVTLPGLPLAVGEPAINPSPRRMMEGVVKALAAEYRRAANAEITISVPNGERLAAKTWNPKLGIIGGISILGTSGVVVPYSCAAWIASIHQGVDVALAQMQNRRPLLAAATGKTSAAATQKLLGLEQWQMIDMGDFVGGLIKYLRKKIGGGGVKEVNEANGSNEVGGRLVIGGGFAKLAKLAAGHMDLHSKRSRFSPKFLAELTDDESLKAKLRLAHSAAAALAIAEAHSKPTAASLALKVAQAARGVADKALGGGLEAEVLVFDRRGELLARATARATARD